MERKVDEESALMRRLAKRLEQTEAELAALPADQKARIEQYLYSRFRWFAREK